MSEIQKALIAMLASQEFRTVISSELGALFDAHQVNPLARSVALAAADSLVQVEVGKLVAAAA